MTTSTKRAGRVGAISLAAALASSALGAAHVAAADDWAWAVVRKTGSSYRIKDKRDSKSSSGGPVTVKRFRRGVWGVKFKGIDARLETIDDQPGVALVTAMTRSKAYCNPQNGWTDRPLLVVVRCFDRRGRVDVPFVVNYLRIEPPGPRRGNVYSNLDSGDYEPRVTQNSHGEGASVETDTPTGRYEVTWPGLGAPYGNAQANAVDQHRTCVLETWLPISGDQRVDIACRGISGQRRNQPFAAIFTNGIGLKGDGGSAWAYLVADQPGAADYIPALVLQASSSGRSARVKRKGKGQYVVKLPGMPKGGAVQVTAISHFGYRCHVDSIRKSGSPQRIGVRCVNAEGTSPRNAVFSLSYVK